MKVTALQEYLQAATEVVVPLWNQLIEQQGASLIKVTTSWTEAAHEKLLERVRQTPATHEAMLTSLVEQIRTGVGKPFMDQLLPGINMVAT